MTLQTPPPPDHSAPITRFRGRYRFLSNFHASPIAIRQTFLTEIPPEPPRQVGVGDGIVFALGEPIYMASTGGPAEFTGYYTAPTVEHAYQAQKTINQAEFEAVLAAPTPAQARRFGKGILHIKRDWDTQRVPIMRELIRLKFLLHPDLAGKLLATGDRDLVEGNVWGDRFWGMTQMPIETAARLKLPMRPLGDSTVFAWGGENWLGRILMERRAVLRGAR